MSDRRSAYDALVYSLLDLSVSDAAESRHASHLRDLPLRGIERIELPPEDYAHYLAAFIEGEKAMMMMRERMLEAMSPALRDLLTREPQRMRIWWHNVPAELDDFPWELTVQAERQRSHQIAFIRGLPPETPLPRIPIAHEPRIGFLGAPWIRPSWADNVSSGRPNAVMLPVSLREGLRQAVEMGLEIVHAFADGYSTSALEGVLYDHAARGERALPAGEISQIVSGSRIVLLSLSAARTDNADVHLIGGREVLSVYRSFIHLGNSRLHLPTVLAPVGPIRDDQSIEFWSAFYEALSGSWSLTEALQNAQARFPFSLPMALFCRHAGGKAFELGYFAASPEPERTTVRNDFLHSQQLTHDIGAIDRKYDGLELPESIHELLKNEDAHQSRLRTSLESWIDEVEP